jgi:hypothetical protein
VIIINNNNPGNPKQGTREQGTENWEPDSGFDYIDVKAY